MATEERISPIFELPTELLVSISEFTSDSDILNWRLSCRDLENASFASFCKRYLSDIKCSVLEPARLLRVHRITSDTRLASKVKRLRFFIDPFELNENCHIAPLEGQSHEMAVNCFNIIYCCSQYALHKTDLAAPDSVLIASIKSILENVKRRRGPFVVFDVYGGMSFHESQDQYAMTFPEDFLKSALQVGSPMEWLMLSDRCSLTPAKYQRHGELWPALQNITVFGYASPRYTAEAQGWEHDNKQFLALKTMIQNMPKLAHLEWRSNCKIFDEEADCFRDFNAELVDAIPRLESFTLAGMDIRVDIICTLVSTFASTLHSVRFEFVNVENRTQHWNDKSGNELDPWTKLFCYLRLLPKLKVVALNEVRVWHAEDEINSVLEFLLPGDEELTRHQKTHYNGIPSQPFLDWNLQHGLIYKPVVYEDDDEEEA